MFYVTRTELSITRIKIAIRYPDKYAHKNCWKFSVLFIPGLLNFLHWTAKLQETARNTRRAISCEKNARHLATPRTNYLPRRAVHSPTLHSSQVAINPCKKPLSPSPYFSQVFNTFTRNSHYYLLSLRTKTDYLEWQDKLYNRKRCARTK